MIDSIMKPVPTEYEDLEEPFDTDPEGVYLPSREKIDRECAEIRRDWSAREYRKRSVEKDSLRWEPPVIHIEQDVQYYLNE